MKKFHLLVALFTNALLLCLSTMAYAITPTANELTKLLASDGADLDEFSWSISIDGDTAVIGAKYNDEKGFRGGAAYVFIHSDGAWSEQQKLTASDGKERDSFGDAVAIDGDTIVVGSELSPSVNIPGVDLEGSAYVFTRNAGVWSEQQKLVASDDSYKDWFGQAVAVDGDTIVVGAHGDDVTGTHSGSAYVFTRSGEVWSEQQKLISSDSAGSDQFGWSVAVDGDTILIGAPNHIESGIRSGAAYVFTRSAGVWSEQQKLTTICDSLSGECNHGWSVALDGDTALIGAYSDGKESGISSGSAYVFSRYAGMWDLQQKLTASDAAEKDWFGYSVAIEGDTAVISALRDDGKVEDSGSAYVFNRNDGVWTESVKLLASDVGYESEGFGRKTGLGISASIVIASSPFHDVAGTDAGATYVFCVRIEREGPITTSVLINPNPVAANTSLSISANVDNTVSGHNIASVSYTLNCASATAMAPIDSAFDEVVENVTATIADGLPVGVYDVCVSGTDSDGNTGTEVCTLLAAYDPSAGFVTGGGWIVSPPGAYIANPSLTGKANFGFVAKYRKGKNEPGGHTEFQFKAADMSFKSSEYDWLVVAGAKGIFKGSGTINGMGNYGFHLSAIDANLTPSTDVDRFRIKIWDKDNMDTLIYDNNMGADGSADPTTAISSGAIVINTAKSH